MMKRPLIYAICSVLLISSLTYSPTVACKNSQKSDDVTVVIACEAKSEVEVTAVVIAERSDMDPVGRLTTVKSSLRAGVAVGKAIGRAAFTLASSMARTARHVAAAMIHSAYELT
jgi:hypothetical protein